jgi:hypothetical protein
MLTHAPSPSTLSDTVTGSLHIAEGSATPTMEASTRNSRTTESAKMRISSKLHALVTEIEKVKLSPALRRVAIGRFVRITSSRCKPAGAHNTANKSGALELSNASSIGSFKLLCQLRLAAKSPS